MHMCMKVKDRVKSLKECFVSQIHFENVIDESQAMLDFDYLLSNMFRHFDNSLKNKRYLKEIQIYISCRNKLKELL
jgi:hypothetical protein